MNDQHRENVARLLHDLEHGDETTRRYAAEDIEFGRFKEAIAGLSTGLGDPSIAVAEACSAALAAIGGAEVAEVIVGNLGSEDVRLRNLTSEVLSELGDAAVPTLANQLKSLDRDVRKFAVDSLLLIRSDDSMRALVVALDDDDVNIAATAADGLGEIGSADHLEILATHLTTEDEWMKCAVVRGIASIGGEKALRLIRPYLGAEDMVVRITTIQGMGKLALTGSAQSLLEMLASNDLGFFGGEVVAALYLVLRELPPEQFPPVDNGAILANLSRLVLEGASDQRMNAAELFCILEIKDHPEALIPAMGDENADLRELVLSCLERLAPASLAPLAAIAQDPAQSLLARDGALRIIAASSLDQRDDLLLTALTSDEADIATSALNYLPSGVGESLSDQLGAHLASPNANLRLAAAGAMGRLAQQQFIALLVPQLKQESEEDIIEAIDNGLIQIGSANVDSSIAPYVQSFTAEERRLAFERYGFEDPRHHLAQIAEGLDDDHVGIRVISLKVLSNLNSLKLEMVEKAIDDADPSVRVEAVRGLGGLNLGDRLAETIKQHVEYQKVTHERVQVELIQLLVKHEVPERSQIIKPFLHSPSTWIRIEAVEALRGFGDSSILPELQQLAETAEEDFLDALEQAIYELEG